VRRHAQLPIDSTRTFFGAKSLTRTNGGSSISRIGRYRDGAQFGEWFAGNDRPKKENSMAKSKVFTRKDFLIKDLAVSIGGGGRGGTWMPGPDDPTPPSPISPIASVLVNIGLIEGVRGAVLEAVKAKQFDEVARAFVPGGTAGNATIRNAIHEIGSAVVASAAYSALGGSVGMPDPNCGGTSFETIPPTITPVVNTGFAVHRVSELPRLKQQLAKTMAFVDKAALAQAPRGTEVGTVRTQLEGALKNLG
jgi:hypothetical protein